MWEGKKFILSENQVTEVQRKNMSAKSSRFQWHEGWKGQKQERDNHEIASIHVGYKVLWLESEMSPTGTHAEYLAFCK